MVLWGSTKRNHLQRNQSLQSKIVTTSPLFMSVTGIIHPDLNIPQIAKKKTVTRKLPLQPTITRKLKNFLLELILTTTQYDFVKRQ